jgi:hypothetical protein
MPAFDELAALDPVQADAGHRLLFTRRFDVTDMLSRLMLPFVPGGPSPVHKDEVLLGGDIQDLGPQVRRRLTPISDDLFNPCTPERSPRACGSASTKNKTGLPCTAVM